MLTAGAGDEGHDHEGHAHGSLRDVQRRALWIALVLNGGFLVAEVIGGIVFNSLALLPTPRTCSPTSSGWASPSSPRR